MRSTITSGFLACLAIAAGLGCGEERRAVDVVSDAAPAADGRLICSGCNVFTQACCDVGEKCAQLVELEDPFLARTTCVPDGDIPEGKACSRGAAGSVTGFDNCAAGLHCLGGVCAPICYTGPPDSCRVDDEPARSGSYCTIIEGVFDDHIGVCVPVPDPAF